jgi:hypothetical protein
MRCAGCQVVRIQGVVCHESGCPEAWKSEKRVCEWCGSAFRPESRRQTFCDASCAAAYAGLEYQDDLPGESRYAGDCEDERSDAAW